MHNKFQISLNSELTGHDVCGEILGLELIMDIERIQYVNAMMAVDAVCICAHIHSLSLRIITEK